MSKGILLSKKHGVNPALGLCAWCGKENGEVILLGKLKNDKEAPRHAVVHDEPCDKCKEVQGRGITLIEVESETGPRTGRWFVISREGAAKIFTGDVVEEVLRVGAARVGREVIKMLGLAPEPKEDA